MSSHTPQPPSPNHWPAVLLFLAAIGVPGAAAFKFADTISKNPWQAFAIALLYEIGIVALAFLRKVWQHLEDEWSKGTADWVNNLVKKQWFSYKRYYARFLTFQHRDFDIKGLSTQSIYTLELEQVFVDLSIDPKPMHQISTNPIPLQVPEELRTGTHSLWNYLIAKPLKNQHIVILGAPGSGKTTLLKHLALTLVNRKKRRSLSRQIKQAYRLPFLLFLREQAEAIHTNPSLSLVEAIETVLSRWERPIPVGWVRRKLSKGKCLILLDGLDEVGDSSLREEVVRWVQGQMEAYATNRFLISSRPFGYRSNPLSGVMMLDVCPFTFEQIQHFVHNWYRANEVMSSQKDDPGVRMRAKAGAQDLIRRIQQTPALLSMAINPLLLTMIATIHRYRGVMPEKRVELYAEICEVFLGKRQQARDMKIDLRPAQYISVLQPLAYEMMVRQQREIATLDAQEIIKNALQFVHEYMSPEAFLQKVENMSGLLLEREQGSYHFAHLTFQEYLAATYIREKGRELTLIVHIGESWWEEITRLYSAQTDATNIIEACLNHVTPSISHLVLALECQEEALRVQPAIKLRLDQALQQAAEDTDPKQKKVVAEALLERRLRKMVPIGENIYQDTSLILNAEYQLFLDEEQVRSLHYSPDHWFRIRFPSGDSLLPIMGIRPSAAQAFCQWLSIREQGRWQYRLPRPDECQPKEIRIRPEWLPLILWDTSYGYWQENGLAFEWIQQPRVNQLEIDLLGYHVQVTALDLDLSTMKPLAVTFVKVTEKERFLDYLARSYTRARDLVLIQDLILIHNHTLTHELVRILARAHTHARTLSPAFSLTLTREMINSSDLVLTLVFQLAGDLATASGFASTHQLAKSLSQDLANIKSIPDLIWALPHILSRISAFAKGLTDISSILFDFDYVTKQHASYFLDLALLLALLNICIIFSAYELFILAPDTPSQSAWKRVSPYPQKSKTFSSKIQEVLNRGIEIYQRLERLEKRRQGKELACEGILIIKERKQNV